MTDGWHSASLISPSPSPLAAAGRAEEVVQRVSHAIQLGLFVDGEQLPPETDPVAAAAEHAAIAAEHGNQARELAERVQPASVFHPAALPLPRGGGTP
jgi:hypothetical protein